MSVGQELRGEEDARSGWHGSEASVVARELGVDPEKGLTVEEARRRLGSHGPNRLAGAKKESGFQAFVRQYRDFTHGHDPHRRQLATIVNAVATR